MNCSTGVTWVPWGTACAQAQRRFLENPYQLLRHGAAVAGLSAA